MKRVSSGDSAIVTTALLSFCLVANLFGLMTFPAVLPEVSAAWHLSASEAGWIGGVYFAGYAVAVLFLIGASDHFDGRWIVAGSSLLGARPGVPRASPSTSSLPSSRQGGIGPA